MVVLAYIILSVLSYAHEDETWSTYQNMQVPMTKMGKLMSNSNTMVKNDKQFTFLFKICSYFSCL